MTDPSVILLNQTDGMVDVLRRRGDRTDILARFPEVRGVEHVAAVAVLFNPADTSLPWRSGDILMARNQGRYPYGRSVIRLRRVHIGRIETWSSETVWSESASALSLRPLRSLALDPLGQLYFSAEGSRNIFRLHRSPGGSWSTGAVASVPSNVPFGGNFALAADGKLYVSSGAGVVPGSVYKSTIRFGDPPPLNPTVNLVAWGKLYLFDEQGGGAIEGFGFYDPDQLVFADGTGAFWQKKVNPRYNPAGPPPPIVPSLPTFPPPPPTLVRHEPGASGVIHSVGPLVTAWTDYLDEHPGAEEAIRWEKGTSSFVSIPEWDSNGITARFRRLLHRFYGAAAAGESGPLSYLRETDPLTGKQRVAPARTATDETVHPDASRLIAPRDAQELMLAHLAVQLWVEVAELTGYRAEELDFAAFDPTESLFQLHDLSPNPIGYLHSQDRVGDVMPNDPVPALDFMLENNLFGQTPADTVYRIGDWMRAKLHHGPRQTPVDWKIPSYGYDGDAPLTSVVEKRTSPYADDDSIPLYWAWRGCHTAAGMYVLLARLANIPGDTPSLWEKWVPAENGGHEHRGVRFDHLRLRSLHSDDFYALKTLEDPAVTAEKTFNAGGAMSYDEINTLTPEVVSTQGECDVSMSHYYRITAQIGVRALSANYLDYFWVKELIGNLAWPDDPGSCESKWIFMPGHIGAVANPPSAALPWVSPGTVYDWSQQTFCAKADAYVAFIRDFLEKHDSILPPGDFETLSRQKDALDEYRRLRGIWLADREA